MHGRLSLELSAGDSYMDDGSLYLELWVSLASLLRSYTAAHGLNGDRQATVELGEDRITVRHGDQWLDLERRGAEIEWRREDGTNGMMEMTEHGRLRSAHPTLSLQNADRIERPELSDSTEAEEEMDMAAERWARELMR